MKSIALLICTFFAHPAFATQAYSGFVNRMHTSYFFHNAKDQAVYSIEAKEPEVVRLLSRLAPGDLIHGQGTIDPKRRTFALKSIEFVALHRLLGPWISGAMSLVFKNFTTIVTKNLSGLTTEYNYSITPGENGEWLIFLSDSKQTVVANLHMDPSMTINGRSTLKRFELTFIEFGSGQVLQTLKLKRP